MIGLSLIMASGLLLGGTLAARMAGRISSRALYGLIAVSQVLNLASAVIERDMFTGSIAAGGFALSAWAWWHDGGGNDTKRRLRRLARRFRGVRRTAPSAA